MWGGGAALAPPSSSQTVKDTRPLRDKPYQAKMKHDIWTYLQASGLDIPRESLSNIQGKDYRIIVESLVAILDPNQYFNPNARFEDQFVPALKSLRYPFAHQIDNKWLAAPAMMHSWPYLLGVLHWLVEMCKVRDSHRSPTIRFH
jgi:kinetochore protein NDC80